MLFLAFLHTICHTYASPYETIEHQNIQLLRSNSRSWKTFKKTWGQWFALWDAKTNNPSVLLGEGFLEENVHKALVDVAKLLNIDHTDLNPLPTVHQGGRTFYRWERSWRGTLVYGDQLTMVAEFGTVHTIWIRIHPIRITDNPLPNEVVYIDSKGHSHLAKKYSEEGHWIFRDRNHVEVGRIARVHHHDVLVSHPQGDVTSPITSSPAKNVSVVDELGNEQFTDEFGFYDLEGPVTATLRSTDLDILSYDLDAPLLRSKSEIDPSQMNVVSVLGVGDLIFPDDTRALTAGTVHYNVHRGLDWLKDRRPDHPWLSETIHARINIPLEPESDGWCNNWYFDGGIYFTVSDEISYGGCQNGGQSSSIIIHELGHGIHEKMLVFGAMTNDVGEGSADYIQATVRDNPVMGQGFYFNTEIDPSRDISQTRIAPQDFTGYPHEDGMVWGSWLWNLREKWNLEYEDGIERTDQLFLRSIEVGPSFSNLGFAVLSADDDNGDLSDGTPHACELIESMASQGIVSSGFGLVQIEHDALDDQESATQMYPLTVLIETWPSECSGFDIDSLKVWYTADESLSHQDRFLWTMLDTTKDVNHWRASIPRHPANSMIRYFFSIDSTDGTQTYLSHGGYEHGVHAFLVGDKKEIYCQDFEGNTDGWTHGPGIQEGISSAESVDDWEIGVSSGEGNTPTVAHSGARIAATNVNGNYRSNNKSHLRSPEIELSRMGMMRFLSFERYLSVEDGTFDTASIWINQREVWSNPDSDRNFDAFIQDGEWKRKQYRMDHVDTRAQVTWSLTADSSIEYGGWGVDDVCIIELDDPVGHYTNANISTQEVGQSIEIRWTTPWITPIEEVTLVRKEGHELPVHPEDGVVVYVDSDIIFGEERVIIDGDALGGREYTYALFYRGTSDKLGHIAPVLEQNARSITTTYREESVKGGCSVIQDKSRTVFWMALISIVALFQRRTTRRSC